MWLLKSYHSPIPGNYFYVQTGKIRQQFKASPTIEEVAKAVSAFRIANKLPRGSLSESLQDVDTFTCSRLLNNDKWCWKCGTEFESVRQNHHFFKKGCPSCGTVVTQ